MARMARVVVPGPPNHVTHCGNRPRIERAPTIGRPLGAPERVAALERRLGRALAPGKPGPKPRVDEDTTREPPLL